MEVDAVDVLERVRREGRAPDRGSSFRERAAATGGQNRALGVSASSESGHIHVSVLSGSGLLVRLVAVVEEDGVAVGVADAGPMADA